MEWTLPVNEYLYDVITKMDHTLIPPGVTGDVRTIRLVQDSVQHVIDNLGRASSDAQGLSRVITTADKLRNAPTHILYLLKDPQAKGGSGEVIGMLKVGRKHLYLYEESAQTKGKFARACEAEPLCVLDFFVVSERQRAGHGRALFDHMLRDQRVHPAALAIDGPSAKMEHFLIKNYNIGRLIRQNNNFAVCPDFFTTSPDIMSAGATANKTRTPTPTPTTDKAGVVGRFTAHKPHSTIASVIHGSEQKNGERASAGATPPNGEAELATREQSAPPEPEPLGVRVEQEPVEAAVAAAAVKRPQWLGLGEEQSDRAAAATAAAAAPAAASTLPAGSATRERRDSQLTSQGYFDIKFYHNKLW